MAKSFKEYIGTGGFAMGSVDNARPMVSLGKTDKPPKRNGRTADTRGMGLTANYDSQAPGTMRPAASTNLKKLKEFDEGIGLDMIKALIPKKILHAFKRAIHAKNYKVALNVYHDLTREIRKDPEKFKRKMGQRDGVTIGNVDNIAKSIAADMAGIKYREFLKILDRKTRYAEYQPEKEKQITETPLYNYMLDKGVIKQEK